MNNQVTIIIPIFNEEENIINLIQLIQKEYQSIHILVIDDFSHDNSVEIINYEISKWNNYLHIITKWKNDIKWLCASIIKWISSIKSEYFIIMDWDFQHPIINIADFLNLFKWKYEIVIWERNNISYKILWFRFLTSKIGNFIIKKTNIFNTNDPLTWFFWGKTDIYLKNINNNKEKFYLSWYKFLFDFLKITKNKKYKTWTFNFTFMKRKHGKSKIWLQVYYQFIKSFF